MSFGLSLAPFNPNIVINVNNDNDNDNSYSDDIPPSMLLTSTQLIRHNSLSKSKRNKSNELASSSVILGFNLYWLLSTSIYINIQEFHYCLSLSKSVYITLDKQVVWKKLFLRDFPFVKIHRNIFHYDYYNAYQLYYQLLLKDYSLFRLIKQFHCIEDRPPLENVEEKSSLFIPREYIKEYEEHENNFKQQIIETDKLLKEYNELANKLNEAKELLIVKRSKELQEHEQKIAEAVKNNLATALVTTELKRQTTDEDLVELEKEIEIKLQSHPGFGLSHLSEEDNHNPVPVFELSSRFYHLFWALMNYEVDAGIDLVELFVQPFLVFIDLNHKSIYIRSSQTCENGAACYSDISTEVYPNLFQCLHLFLFSPILFRKSHSLHIEEFYRYKEFSLNTDNTVYKDYFLNASGQWTLLERLFASLVENSHLQTNLDTIQRILPTPSLNAFLRRLEGLCIQTNFAISKKNKLFELITIFIQGNNVRIVSNHYDNEIVYNVISFKEEEKKSILESENNKLSKSSNGTNKNHNSLIEIPSEDNKSNPVNIDNNTKKKYRRRKTRKRLWKKHLLREKELKNRAKHELDKEDPDEGKLKANSDSDHNHNDDNDADSDENNQFQPSSSSDEEITNSNQNNNTDQYNHTYSSGPISKIYSAIRLLSAEKLSLIESDLSVGILIIERTNLVGNRDKPTRITIRTDEIYLKNQTIQVTIERGNAKTKKEKWIISKLNE